MAILKKYFFIIGWGLVLFLALLIWLLFCHFWWFVGVCCAILALWYFGIKNAILVPPEDPDF